MRKKLWISGIILLWILSMAACGRQKGSEEPKETVVTLDKRQMQSVCELATLKCYYHNTAKFDSEKKVWFWNTSKKLWIEYSGIVQVGVDFSKLDMKVEGNQVTIVLPKAKVLSCDVDDQSLTEDAFYSETKGLGSGKITAEDQSEAFQAAQEGMREAAEADELLLQQAQMRAQTLIENYVKNIGELMGVEYEIQWETAEEESSASEEE